jgi:hypothetical protein
MAHFAKIENEIVREIIVVNDEVLLDENGDENESLGISFCQSLFGEETQWVQTSYNGTFRGKYAAPSDKWDGETFSFWDNSEA